MERLVKLRGSAVSKWVVWGSITLLTILELLPVYHVSSAFAKPHSCRRTITQLVFVCPIDNSSPDAKGIRALCSVAYDVIGDRLVSNYKLVMVNPMHVELPTEYVKGNESQILMFKFGYIKSPNKILSDCKISMAYSVYHTGCAIVFPDNFEEGIKMCFYDGDNELSATDLAKRMVYMFDSRMLNGYLRYMLDSSKSTLPLGPLPE